jgi:tRNA pseudouridine38-40 synthase
MRWRNKLEVRYKNIKLIIEYDGSNYSGWQRQKDSPSIQGVIESAISKMTGQQISLIGSGHTDAGTGDGTSMILCFSLKDSTSCQ